MENIFVKTPFLAQIYVHGDSLQNELVAIGVPDAEYCVKWAIGKGLLPSSTPIPEPTSPGKAPSAVVVKLAALDELRIAVLADLKRIGVEERVRGFEFIKQVFLDAVPFSIEDGLLTPTFKLKRAQIAEKYRPNIDKMYASMPKTASKL